MFTFPRHSVALHIEPFGTEISVFFFYMTHYFVLYIYTISLEYRVAAGCFFGYITQASQHIFSHCDFSGRKIDCDLQGRKINFLNSKTLVGRCRDRPSSTLLLICPKEMNLSNQRRKRKWKKATTKKERKKTRPSRGTLISDRDGTCPNVKNFCFKKERKRNKNASNKK